MLLCKLHHAREETILNYWEKSGLNIVVAKIRNINTGTGRSIIQFLIRRIEQFLNSPIQFIDFIGLINSIRNLRIEAICDQFAGWSSIR
jgi:hypothetical protein